MGKNRLNEFLDLVEEAFEKEFVKHSRESFRKMVDEAIEPLLLSKPEEVEEKFKTHFKKAIPYLILPSFFLDIKNPVKAMEVQKRLYDILKKEIPPSLLDAFETLSDASSLIISKIMELGIVDFIKVIVERAEEEYKEFFIDYLLTYFTFLICLVGEKKEIAEPKTLDKLREKLDRYVEELDTDITTIDLLITDEDYEVVKNYI
ncbi:hypothetical protein B6U74_06145 [Candidatus Bathyarchaeota archaeon ex4484_205]|nr:MAG: hypothetical protein B6U74_06145 [Candidatus Bathyarchaeota archaeon ex4484_205]